MYIDTVIGGGSFVEASSSTSSAFTLIFGNKLINNKSHFSKKISSLHRTTKIRKNLPRFNRFLLAPPMKNAHNKS